MIQISIPIDPSKEYCIQFLLSSLEAQTYPLKDTQYCFAVTPYHTTGDYSKSVKKMWGFKHRLETRLDDSSLEWWSVDETPLTEDDYDSNLLYDRKLHLLGPVIKNRHYLQKKYLESSCQFNLLMDADNPLPPHTLQTLYNHIHKRDVDLVAGLLFNRLKNPLSQEYTPFIYRYRMKPSPSDSCFHSWKYLYKLDSIPSCEWKEFMRVDAGPISSLLVTRNVMEKIEWKIGVIVGEDMEFYHQANLKGFHAWIDTKLIIPHVTPQGEWITGFHGNKNNRG